MGLIQVMKFPNNLKRLLIVALQIGLFVFAIICVLYGSFALRSIGILAVFCALAIGRKSRPVYFTPEPTDMQSALALRPWHWIVGLTFFVAWLASYVWLQQDAMSGGKSATPVYVLALVVVLGGIWWAVLIGRWIQSRPQ